MKNKLDNIYDDNEVVSKQYFFATNTQPNAIKLIFNGLYQLNQNGTWPKCWYTFSDFNKMQNAITTFIDAWAIWQTIQVSDLSTFLIDND